MSTSTQTITSGVTSVTTPDYKEIARASRLKVLELVYKAQTSHIGSLLGCADIFAVLFEKIKLDKDKFVLSAGWKAAMLYYHLWRNGRITDEELDSYCQEGSKFIGLAEPIHKDIVFAGGSMGMGISAGVALGWSKKKRKQDGRIYILESDGGMQPGMNWEAFPFAVREKLNNVTLIIDDNGHQAMGKTREISPISLRDTLSAFGWAVLEINGHDYLDIEFALSQTHGERPLAIIAATIKGKGWKRAEDNNTYHYKQLSQDEYEEAKTELNG